MEFPGREGRFLILFIHTDRKRRMQRGDNGFHVEYKDYAIFQTHHAGNGTTAHLHEEAAGRFNLLPADAMDTGDAGNEKGGLNIVELGNNDF